MQNILAGAAIGSIITGIIGIAWHCASVADLVDDNRKFKGDFQHTCNRLQSIIDRFKHGKSGTAKLAVKIARGEVA